MSAPLRPPTLQLPGHSPNFSATHEEIRTRALFSVCVAAHSHMPPLSPFWAGLFWFARSFGRHPRTGRAHRQGGGDASLKEQLAQGLTPYQLSLLEKVRRANTEPIVKYPRKSERPEADQLASVEIHKRVNPGYVEMPYESSNSRDYKYMAAPDFTREYLKSDSDLHFAKFAAAALSHSVPLNKTSH